MFRAVLLSCAIVAASLAEEALILPELLVAEAPAPSAEAGVSLTETLHSLPGVRLLPQGVGGQSDLSIQGSSFSGAGLSLHGLALRNPQTEHFHSELPVLPEVFGAVAVRTGLDQQAMTSTHLAGSVDFGLGPMRRGGRLTLGLGEFSARETSLYGAETMPVADGTLGVAAFAAFAEADGDPWRDNDLRRNLGGLHLQFRRADWQFDTLLARGSKTFGARGYYGAPATLPSEETVRDSLFFVSARKGDLAGEYLRLAAAWRELRDTYLLDASRPFLYENRHHSRLLTAAADQRLLLDESWSFLWRLEAEREDLDSTYRGTIPAAPLGEHWRARASLFALPEYRVGDWRFAAGLRTTAFTDDAPAWLPAAAIVWTPAPETELSLAYSETVRLPSYTELNYNSPTSLGNAGLKRQHARSLELAAKAPLGERVRIRSLAFFRRESESVDWVKTAPGNPWQAVNLDTVDVFGLRLGGEFDLGANWRFLAEGEWLHKDCATQPHASRYALDYPEASLRCGIRWQALSWCEVSAEQGFARHPGNPERNTGRSVWPAALAVTLRPPARANLTLTFRLGNLWDERHEPVVGVEAPGRRASASLAYAW